MIRNSARRRSHRTEANPADAERQLPPGPRLPSALQTWLYLARHRGAPRAWRDRYGETFTLRVYPNRRLLALTTPSAIQKLLRGSPAELTASGGNKVLEPIVGSNSLLLIDGPRHRRARAIQTPAFHGAALRGYPATIASLTQHAIADWPRNKPVEMLPLTSDLTLDVIFRLVFGVTDSHRLEELRVIVRDLIDLSPLEIGAQLLPIARSSPIATRTQRTSGRLRHRLAAEIAHRRETGIDDETVVSRLLQCTDLTDDELLDHLVTLLVAGHETTAKALAWALHDLAHHPHIQHLTYMAAGKDDDDYLTSVVKETLRLHNIVGQVSRTVHATTNVAGHELRPGTLVAAQLDLLHHNPDHHPDPSAFKPERFLDNPPSSTTYVPFGSGVHRCLGAEFAIMESVAIIREVVMHLHLRPAGEREKARTRNITSGPSRGGSLVLIDRI